MPPRPPRNARSQSGWREEHPPSLLPAPVWLPPRFLHSFFLRIHPVPRASKRAAGAASPCARKTPALTLCGRLACAGLIRQKTPEINPQRPHRSPAAGRKGVSNTGSLCPPPAPHGACGVSLRNQKRMEVYDVREYICCEYEEF